MLKLINICGIFSIFSLWAADSGTFSEGQNSIEALLGIATSRLDYFNSWYQENQIKQYEAKNTASVGTKSGHEQYAEMQKTLKPNIIKFKFLKKMLIEIQTEEDSSARILKTSALYATIKCLYKNETRVFSLIDPAVSERFREEDVENIFNLKTLQGMIEVLGQLEILPSHKHFDRSIEITGDGQCCIVNSIMVRCKSQIDITKASTTSFFQILNCLKGRALESAKAKIRPFELEEIIHEIEARQQIIGQQRDIIAATYRAALEKHPSLNL